METRFGLYAILTDPVVGWEESARAVIAARIPFLQLRVKGQTEAEILPLARRLRRLTAGTATRFIINDFPALAAEVEADGVHLGQEDLPLAEARKILTRPGAIFGLSTHNAHQARAALAQRPDYIGVGPVFPTPTKARPDPVLGLEEMGRIIRATPLPAVAIGGITLENLAAVLSAGAVNFAVVRPLMSAPDPGRVIASFQRVWREYYSPPDLAGSGS